MATAFSSLRPRGPKRCSATRRWPCTPSDERYRALIGRQIRLPLGDRLIPIIGDEYVDPEFGTGCVKITPAHDFNDYAVGERHGLPLINIFDESARLNDAVPQVYRGLDRFVARERIVADLETAGLLAGIDDHVSTIPRGDRSGVSRRTAAHGPVVRARPTARRTRYRGRRARSRAVRSRQLHECLL